MKGEVMRRISVDIKDKRVDSDNPAKKANDREDGSVDINDIRVHSDIAAKKEKDRGDGEEEDYLVNTIGAFGLWQAVVAATVTLTRAIAIWNMASLTFLTPKTEFVCVEFSDNTRDEVYNSTCYENCLKYKYWSIIGKTVEEEFGLICDKAWLASFMQSILMLGTLIGVSLFGYISDRFGRRSALLISTFTNAILMIVLPFSPTYIIFTSIRFMIGIATGGSLLVCVVQVMEIVGKKYREAAGAYFLITDGMSQAVLAGFAYFTTNWKAFTLSYGLATCIIFIFILFVPESPRWLLAHGKVDDAIKVITRAANRNKLDTSNITAEITKALEDMKLKDNERIKTSYFNFFKSKALFLLTLSMFISWFTMGICLYGIYQYVTIIGVDPYLTVVITGLILIPVCPLSIIISRRFGRRSSTIGTKIGTTVVMLAIIFVPKGNWLVTMLGVLAFIFCNIFFVIAYIYVSELYPTRLRNMSYGWVSGGAKIGAMVAPFIANLTPSCLPSLIFCVVPVMGALSCLFVPETKGQNLKDTMKE